MIVMDLVDLFRGELEARTGITAVVGPTVVKPAAPRIKIIPGKLSRRHEMQGDDEAPVLILPLRISLEAEIEGSGAGLKRTANAALQLSTALDALDTLDGAPGSEISSSPLDDSVYEEDQAEGRLFGVSDR